MPTPEGMSTGYGGLTYEITQISLAVSDLEGTMETYWRAFGWTGWDVYNHIPPVHHNTELRGRNVDYSLRGAEVMVGSVNFELLEPLDGPSVWREFIDTKGDGACSIAVMFKEAEEAQIVKQEFLTRGIPTIMRANIGEHIEYYYLDTQSRFGCLIESGSGHAKDFVSPAYVYPSSTSPPTEKAGELNYPITQVSLVVNDLDSRMRAYKEAFGWGPWKIYQADGKEIMHDCELNGQPSDYFNIRWAEVQVGDLNFELIQPLGGDNPWQRSLDQKGEGIASIAMMFRSDEESTLVREQFDKSGIGVTALGRIGDHIEWYYLDTGPGFKCVIESGSGHALDFMETSEVFP
jgi:methylmalonyl-CoA/ethylmalonyl-CoA epimerase